MSDCKHCGKPRATQEQWDMTYPEERLRAGICWVSPGVGHDGEDVDVSERRYTRAEVEALLRRQSRACVEAARERATETRNAYGGSAPATPVAFSIVQAVEATPLVTGDAAPVEHTDECRAEFNLGGCSCAPVEVEPRAKCPKCGFEKCWVGCLGVEVEPRVVELVRAARDATEELGQTSYDVSELDAALAKFPEVK